MGKETKIEWCDFTFNPWRGCVKVSDGCANCYAEALAKRNPLVLGEWGPGSNRSIASEKYWGEPVKWNDRAKHAQRRPRVFCASLGDVFEDREDLVEHRARLFDLILKTPNLDWLILTKRPENIRRHLEQIHNGAPSLLQLMPLKNLWLGVTIENEKQAALRMPELAQIPAAIRFLSVEPLLEKVCLGLFGTAPKDWGENYSLVCDYFDWVIVGGESGPGARPMKEEWALAIRDECIQAEVPFLFKQWGEFNAVGDRVGKKKAGRKLDGAVWNQFPPSG